MSLVVQWYPVHMPLLNDHYLHVCNSNSIKKFYCTKFSIFESIIGTLFPILHHQNLLAVIFVFDTQAQWNPLPRDIGMTHCKKPTEGVFVIPRGHNWMKVVDESKICLVQGTWSVMIFFCFFYITTNGKFLKRLYFLSAAKEASSMGSVKGLYNL